MQIKQKLTWEPLRVVIRTTTAQLFWKHSAGYISRPNEKQFGTAQDVTEEYGNLKYNQYLWGPMELHTFQKP